MKEQENEQTYINTFLENLAIFLQFLKIGRRLLHHIGQRHLSHAQNLRNRENLGDVALLIPYLKIRVWHGDR
jgi:hypothetical protein